MIKPDYLNRIIALALIMLVLGVEYAYAQATVDVRPTINAALEYAFTALATVLTVLGGFGIRYVSSRIGMSNSELEASLNARLNDIIHKGIDYAYIAATNEVNKPGSGLEAVKFDNWFMSLAATYVNRGAPDIIKKFALSQERIQDMIMARLPAYVAQIPVEGGLPTSPSVKEINRELNVDQGKTASADSVGTGAVKPLSKPEGTPITAPVTIPEVNTTTG